MSIISSLEIINVVEQDPNIFLLIAVSVAGAAAANPNSMKTLFANGLSTFLLKSIQFLVVVLKVYLKILLILLFYAIEFLIILY